MKNPSGPENRPSVVWLYVSAAAYALWNLGLAVMAVLHRFSS